MLPDFLVIGVPKAGTTALHAALSWHPQLFLSVVKEPKFFLTDGPPPRRGGPGDVQTYREHIWRLADYEGLFDAAPPGALRGESTPFYLHDAGAVARIRRLVPQARLIVVLRDPVERAHSNWAHMWSAGLEPIGDFLLACADEDRRAGEGWSAFWRYKGLGRYGEQLRRLYGFFPRDQVLVLRYRDLVDSPCQALDRICRFLGVADGVITKVPRENVTAHPPATAAHSALSRVLRAGVAAGRLLPDTAGTAVVRPVERMLQRRANTRRSLGWHQRQALLPYFEPDIAVLESVTGEVFSDWLGPRDRSGGLVGSRPAGQRQARNGRPRRR